ncbi:MAG: hypothetical protein R3C26_06705 [Calditrichia bacterium]
MGQKASLSSDSKFTIPNALLVISFYEQRVVGPPYNSVLPKYEGDMEKLKQFILNPVKVNADYIAMPNQGLKPHEAESAAMFLMKEYEEKYKNQ